jgi:hypothetical protein
MTLSLITAKAALVLTIASTALGSGAGCMSRSSPSSTRIASSEAAIRTARDLGAERIPDASVHLDLAQGQLYRALRYIQEGDDWNARWMLVRADADAHLALALTREARTKEAAEEMAARVRELSTSLQGRSPEPM